MEPTTSNLQTPSLATPSPNPPGKGDTRVVKTTENVVTTTMSDDPVPIITLASGRFVAQTLLSVGIFATVLAWIATGVTIREHTASDKVDRWIEFYQVVNGIVTTVVGNVFGGYVAVFIAVATIFLRNVRWYPGDDPKRSYSRIKRLVLWAFSPVVVYNIRVAITATYVSQIPISPMRIFIQGDLLVANTTTTINMTTTGNGVNVLDTILRGAVLQKVVPFQMKANTGCSRENSTPDDSWFGLPTVKEVRSTAVVYNFPTRDWNLDAMPFGLVPSHNFSVQLKDSMMTAEEAHRMGIFMEEADVSWLTLYEMFLQGKLLFERSVSPRVHANRHVFSVDALAKPQVATSKHPERTRVGLPVGRHDEIRVGLHLTRHRIHQLEVLQHALHGQHAVRSFEMLPQLEFLERIVGHHFCGPLVIEDLADEVDHQHRIEDDLVLAEAGVSSKYPCVWADGKHHDDFDENDPKIVPNDPRIFTERVYKGKRRCLGIVSSLRALGNISDPAKHTVNAFQESVTGAFVNTTTEIEPQSMSLSIEVYKINAQLRLTSLTLDMPYHKNRQYRDTADFCNGSSLLPELRAYLTAGATTDNTTNADGVENLEKMLCYQENYPFIDPGVTCGRRNCIFLDQSETISFKKQLQLMPYVNNCSTDDLQYNAQLRSFSPTTCMQLRDTAFLYGLGTYLSGDEFDSGIQYGIPYISNPRRHVVLTFGKLEWFFNDINTNFDAECDVNSTTHPSQCSGLLYELENVTVPALNVTGESEIYKRVLILSENELPESFRSADYTAPVQLVTLNSRPLFYSKLEKFYEWEYLDFKHFEWTDWSEPIERCSPLVESYITTVEKNNYYMDDPRQPLYTAALFYLFQDAAVKTVNKGKWSLWEPSRWNI